MIENKLKKISKKIGPNKKFLIYAAKKENEFHRTNINPYFLYFTNLEVKDVIPNSVLLVDTNLQTCDITIYYEKDDKLGLDYKNVKINLKPLKELPNLPEITKIIMQKVDSLREIKDKWEIKQIKDAIKITEIGFDKIDNFIKKNKKISEKDLESVFIDVLLHNDASPAYSPIIASGKNAAHVHYNINSSNISKNDLILMDIGAKNKYGYCADITRTILPKEHSKYQENVYNIVKTAFDECFDYVCKNEKIKLADVDKICRKSFSKLLYKLKIKDNDNWNKFLDNCSTNDFYLHKLYPHLIGHQVGLEVHDPGKGILKKGMVFTIEPGLYFPEDDPIIPNAYKKVGGVRIEHMILMDDKPIIIG